MGLDGDRLAFKGSLVSAPPALSRSRVFGFLCAGLPAEEGRLREFLQTLERVRGRIRGREWRVLAR